MAAPIEETTLTIPPEKYSDIGEWEQLFKLITTEPEKVIKDRIVKHIEKLIESSTSKYKILFLYRTQGMIDDFDADNIYKNLPKADDKKNIMLILNSTGGRIEPAYLISKCCNERKVDTFVVCIPRRAKSAATLISLGADEIHMGPMSEMGPIDPQINGLPALALSSALECLANMAKKYPESTNMLAEYLAKTLPLNILGYFERISVSAEHYAVRLLQNTNKAKGNIQEIAHKLVYEYKDHSFVIDKDESQKLLGPNIVKVETDEYSLGNAIYMFMEQVNLISKFVKNKVFNLIGAPSDLNCIDANP